MNFKRFFTFLLVSLTFTTKAIHYHYHYNKAPASHKGEMRPVMISNLQRKTLNSGLQFVDKPKIITTKEPLGPVTFWFEEKTDPVTGESGTVIWSPRKNLCLSRTRRNPDGSPNASYTDFRGIEQLWDIEYTATPGRVYIKAKGKDTGYYLSHGTANYEESDRTSTADATLAKSRGSTSLWNTIVGY